MSGPGASSRTNYKGDISPGVGRQIKAVILMIVKDRAVWTAGLEPPRAELFLIFDLIIEIYLLFDKTGFDWSQTDVHWKVPSIRQNTFIKTDKAP